MSASALSKSRCRNTEHSSSFVTVHHRYRPSKALMMGGLTMDTSHQKYEAYACEYARLAGLTNDEVSRDRLLRIACHWMETAAHERCARVVVPAPHSRHPSPRRHRVGLALRVPKEPCP